MSKVLIIGAGIMGLSTAYYLQKKGYQVTIIDKGEIRDNCSLGNAGMIVPSHFVPLASPGMITQGIRWMFDSKSPFYVRPSLNIELIKWGLKFMKHANQQHVSKSAIPLRDLSLLSKKLYQELASEEDFKFELNNHGILAYYKTEKAAEEEAHLAAKGRELGLDMAVLDAAACRNIQPKLDMDVLGAVHYRCDSHLYPAKLISALSKYLESNGVEICRGEEVQRIEKENGKISAVYTDKRLWKADQYVLATGSWSPAIAKLAGLQISIMPGKGYSFMESEAEERLTIPALLCEARVAITPMNGSLRFGGTMELDRINDRVNLQRVKGIVESVPKYFPELQPAMPEPGKVWFGFRPSSPDGLPYIGRSKGLNNLVIATGHGMMGLSLGPATGYLLSQLIGEERMEMDISMFSPDR